MPRLYFGHPINTYQTPLEGELLQAIAAAFPAYDIENPSDPHHQYGARRQHWLTGNVMDYFLPVAAGCRLGVFLPFRDGCWGAGVHAEALVMTHHGRGIFSIDPSGLVRRADLATVIALTVDQTRQRIRAPDGTIIPY